MEQKAQKNYITGLKGIACILILLGHSVGIYKYAQNFQPNIPVIDAILNSIFSNIFNEGFWLYLFFLTSGYLIAKSQIKTIWDVLLKSLKRFFRLAFPIFFSYLVIYLIYVFVGFHNNQTIDLFRCDWYQNFYSGTYSIKHVLTGPIDVLLKKKIYLNAPYWVLKEMFKASILIYILKYCYEHLSNKSEIICFFTLLLITFVSSFVSTPIVTACLIGMFVSIFENIEKILEKRHYVFGTIVMAIILCAFYPIQINSIVFAILIAIIPKIKVADLVFSSKPFLFLGKISWGIYSFHWPLMCSFGALILIDLYSKIGLLSSYAISSLLVTLMTLVISIVFYYTFERLSLCLSGSIDKGLRKIILHLKNR